MRVITTFILVSIGLVAHSQKDPVKVADGFKIEIKTSAVCEMCKEALEYDLAFEKGVKEATLNLDDKVLSIIYNPKRTDPDKLRERVTKVGYHADWMNRIDLSYEKLPFCCKDGAHGTPVPQLPTKKKGDN
ncbi:MAG: heavy-metal-associated domain-containing protein [Ekhidna sp.]